MWNGSPHFYIAMSVTMSARKITFGLFDCSFLRIACATCFALSILYANVSSQSHRIVDSTYVSGLELISLMSLMFLSESGLLRLAFVAASSSCKIGDDYILN